MQYVSILISIPIVPYTLALHKDVIALRTDSYKQIYACTVINKEC